MVNKTGIIARILAEHFGKNSKNLFNDKKEWSSYLVKVKEKHM